MSARLPTRPAPMHGGAATGRRAEGRGPLERRPLALIFRRPARALPAPVMRSRDGAAVRLSLSLSLRVWLAERLTTLVREVAPASLVGRTPRSAAAPGGTRAPVAVTSRAWRLSAASVPGPERSARGPLSLREAAAVRKGAARRDGDTPAGRAGVSGSETAPTRRSVSQATPPSDGDGRRRPVGSRPSTRPTPAAVAEVRHPAAPGTTPRRRARGPRLGAVGEPLTERRGGPAAAAPVPARRRLRPPARPGGPRPGGDPATELRAAAGPRLRTVVQPPPAAPPALEPLAGPGRRPPAALVHRDRPTVVEASAPPAPAPAPAAPAAPAVDLDRLDRELWHRFEKRMRIERERRGRG